MAHKRKFVTIINFHGEPADDATLAGRILAATQLAEHPEGASGLSVWAINPDDHYELKRADTAMIMWQRANQEDIFVWAEYIEEHGDRQTREDMYNCACTVNYIMDACKRQNENIFANVAPDIDVVPFITRLLRDKDTNERTLKRDNLIPTNIIVNKTMEFFG